MTEALGLTPAQTAGPYLSIGLLRDLVPTAPSIRPTPGDPHPRTLLDGAGEGVGDGLVEIWQADEDGGTGRRRSSGFGRPARRTGRFEFVTLKPGRVPWPDGGLQAPHVAVGILARGLLKRVVTRLYFPDEVEANERDPVLSALVPGAARDAGRRAGGRRPPVRHPACRGRRKRHSSRCDGVRRPVRPRRDPRCRLGAVVAGGDARRGEARWPRRALGGSRPRRASAEAIAECAPVDAFRWEELIDQGHAVGNPAEPLVRALRARRRRARAVRPLRGDEPGHPRHRRDARRPRVHRAHPARRRPSRRAVRGARPGSPGHADGREDAAPAGGADDVRPRRSRLARRLLDARRRLRDLADTGLAVQLGGAAGTLAALGEDGTRVVDELARARSSGADASWHTNRVRVAELGAALGRWPASAGRSGSTSSSSRRPRWGRCARARAEARRRCRRSGTRFVRRWRERAPAWPLHTRRCSRAPRAGARARGRRVARGVGGACGALAFAGGAADAASESLGGLEVDADRMRANLDASGGLIVAERVAFVLAGRVGRGAAHELVAAAAGAPGFREALVADPRNPLSAEELDALLDPVGYLGSAEALVDRALDRYDAERKGATG